MKSSILHDKDWEFEVFFLQSALLSDVFLMVEGLRE